MKCPHCQNKIEVPDLWEFFDCTSCGASLQLENNELKILKEPNESTSTNYKQELQQKESVNSPTETLNSGEIQEDFVEPSADSSFSNNPEETVPENFSEIPNTDTPQSLESISENKNEQTESTETPSSEKDENLSNILDFGSSPNQKNHFTYHLHISEISSKALFDKIRYILKSPRVRLDCPNQATNNILVINNLNAVQMVYLVRKLSPLSVQIHWTQKSTLTE